MNKSRRNFMKTACVAAAGAVSANEWALAGTAGAPIIKIGQIGTKHMHAYKLGTLRKLTGLFEVVGVVEDDMTQRKAVGNRPEYKGLKWMTTEELLAVPGLQAVGIETDEHVSLPAALRCVTAGKHIHLDKPPGESLKDFKQVLDVAKAKSLTVQMGYMYRANPAVQFCFKAVKEGLLGDIYDVDAAMNRYDGVSFRNRLVKYEGGAAYIFACHLIDIVVTMMGRPERIHPFLRRTRADGLIDNSLTVFEYPRDAIATLRASINEVEGFSRRYLTVRGTRGTIRIEPLESRANMSGGVLQLALLEANGEFQKGYQTVKMPPLKDRYEDQWIEFAKVINGEMRNPYTYDHDYVVQECLLKACALPAK